MNYALTKKSGNAKTGAIPVSTSHKDTCPNSCPFKSNGCYASAGYYTDLHWKKVSTGERGTDFNTFASQVAKLPADVLWRHNVAGDLAPTASNNANIDAKKLSQLTSVNRGKRGFTYTHHKLNAGNVRKIKRAISDGFTVNASANSPKEAAQIRKQHGLPTVTVLPSSVEGRQTIIQDGETIVVCPATYRDDVTCATCGLCQVPDRAVIVGFPAHGAQAKTVNIIAKG